MTTPLFLLITPLIFLLLAVALVHSCARANREERDRGREQNRAIRMAALIDLVTEPETHRKILGDYTGGYSLGVGQDEAGEFVLVLSVFDKDAVFPEVIQLHDEDVRVIVRTEFFPVAL